MASPASAPEKDGDRLGVAGAAPLDLTFQLRREGRGGTYRNERRLMR